MCELGMYFGRIYKVVIRLRMLKKLCWRVGALAHTHRLYLLGISICCYRAFQNHVYTSNNAVGLAIYRMAPLYVQRDTKPDR